MKMGHMLNKWNWALLENKYSRYAVVGLVACLAITLGMLVFKKPVVILQPYTLKQEAFVTADEAGQSYHEAWGMFLSLLMGNITPGNVQFVRERLEPLLSPRIFQEAMEAIQSQAEIIRKDRISMTFEPRNVVFERASGKVFVFGNSSVISPNGETRRDRRTYEFRIKIDNYLPVVTFMTTYADRPHTLDVLEKQSKAAERAAERASKAAK